CTCPVIPAAVGRYRRPTLTPVLSPRRAAPEPVGPPSVQGMLSASEIQELLRAPLDELVREAGRLRDRGHGSRITFSPKVFIPLTMLCRDRCGYCTFAKPPARLESPYLPLEQVLDIARVGASRGCHEALFTLGEA